MRCEKRKYTFFLYDQNGHNSIDFLETLYSMTAAIFSFFLSFFLPFSRAFFALFLGSRDHPGQRTTFPLSRLCSFLPSNTRERLRSIEKTPRERGRMKMKIEFVCFFDSRPKICDIFSILGERTRARERRCVSSIVRVLLNV